MRRTLHSPLLIALALVCGFTLLACQPVMPEAATADSAAGTIPAADAGTIPAAEGGTIPAADTGELDIPATYAASLQDAKVAEPSEIYDGLTAITPDNDNLTWQAETGRILMLTWTSWNGYDPLVGQETQLGRETWVTATPQLQTFCQRYEPTDAMPLTLRLEGLLGLPPNNGKTRMVTMWVDPADLFRPAPDGEIDDSVAELELPGPDHFASQQAYEFHRDWYNLQLSLQNYDDPSKGYPWTRLGYTYDWANPASEVGLSEFVVTAGSTVAIDQVYTTEEYCGS